MDSFLVENIQVSSLITMAIGLMLLLVSAFMSSSEAAFFSLKPNDIDEIKNSNNAEDITLYKLINNSEKLLATILIGNNLVNIAIVLLLSFSLSQIFDFGSNKVVEFIVETVLLTLLLLLFGEIIPKVYAQHKPLSYSRFAANKMTIINNIFSPISLFIIKSTNIVTKRIQNKKYDISVDDLSQAVDILEDNLGDGKAMFEEIINFYNKTASEVMTPRIDMVAVDISSNFDEMLKYVLDSGYSRIPVYDNSKDNIKGVLYIKDLIPHRRKDSSFHWQNLIRKAYFVPENKRIDDLLEECQRNKIHMCIVVDEYGGTSGVITLEDILEEIIGEISDEYDDEKLPYTKLQDGSYVFEAKTPIVDVLRYLDLESGDFGEYEDAVDTLGGLVIEIKQDLPKLHDVVCVENWKFEIVEVDKFRILKVKVTNNIQK